jgi:hypothetical protein
VRLFRDVRLLVTCSLSCTQMTHKWHLQYEKRLSPPHTSPLNASCAPPPLIRLMPPVHPRRPWPAQVSVLHMGNCGRAFVVKYPAPGDGGAESTAERKCGRHGLVRRQSRGGAPRMRGPLRRVRQRDVQRLRHRLVAAQVAIESKL